MSLVLNMVGGSGGGKLKDTDAVLVVTVPTGSTVTATKSGTTLTPTMWVKAADNTLDCAIFSIPASQFDSTTPWTITATLGTYSATATVTIDSNKQYDLSMAAKWFIRDGVLVNPLFEIFGNVTASQGSGVYTIQTTSNNTGGLKAANVDLSRFTTIVLELSSGCKSWKGTGVPAVGFGNGIKVSDDNVVGFTGSTYLSNATGNIGQGQYTVDVSAVDGSCEVACSVGGSKSLSPTNGILNIVNAYLK